MFRSNVPRVPGDRDSRILQKHLENYPEGYPRISAYIDSDVDTILFRRFGVLHARSLLYKQVELTELEAQLDKLDKDDEGTDEDKPDRWRLGDSLLEDGADNEARRDLMEKIDKKMEVYDNLLLREANLRKLSRPSKRVYQNFMDFIYTEHPFTDADERFIWHKDDFVLLEDLGKECWLDDVMHDLVPLSKDFLPIFASSDDRNKTSDPHVFYYSNDRLATLIEIVIAFASTALLLVPVYLFLSFDLSTAQMTMIASVLALLFSAAVSVLTNAKRQGVFAATAAYCAVLVVFIGIVQQGRAFQLSSARREPHLLVADSPRPMNLHVADSPRSMYILVANSLRSIYLLLADRLEPTFLILKTLWPDSTSSYVFFTLFCIFFILFGMIFYLHVRRIREEQSAR